MSRCAVPSQLAGKLKNMFEVRQGKVQTPTVKGGLLAALGNLLELAPDKFTGGRGCFGAEWLLEQSTHLIRDQKTTATLREGALAGLNSALCIQVPAPICSSH